MRCTGLGHLSSETAGVSHLDSEMGWYGPPTHWNGLVWATYLTKWISWGCLPCEMGPLCKTWPVNDLVWVTWPLRKANANHLANEMDQCGSPPPFKRWSYAHCTILKCCKLLLFVNRLVQNCQNIFKVYIIR